MVVFCWCKRGGMRGKREEKTVAPTLLKMRHSIQLFLIGHFESNPAGWAVNFAAVLAGFGFRKDSEVQNKRWRRSPPFGFVQKFCLWKSVVSGSLFRGYPRLLTLGVSAFFIASANQA